MASTFQDRVVTPDNYSSVPAIINWLVGVAITLCVIAKFATKLTRRNKLGEDDITILISMVFGFGAVACIAVASENGLGRPLSMTDTERLDRFQKSVYAADILYIVSLSASKLSMLAVLKVLASVGRYETLFSRITIIVALWTIATTLASMFQCAVPDVWAVINGKCFNQSVFWGFHTVINILTELGISAIPLLVLADTKLARKQKMTVLTLFWVRLLILGPIIAEIYFRQTQSAYKNGLTFGLWPVAVCRQLILGLSIIFACVPFMKPFFVSLDHGMTRIDDQRRLANRTTYISDVRSWYTERRNGRADLPQKVPSESKAEAHQSYAAPTPSIAPSRLTQTTTIDVYMDQHGLVHGKNGTIFSPAINHDEMFSSFPEKTRT